MTDSIYKISDVLSEFDTKFEWEGCDAEDAEDEWTLLFNSPDKIKQFITDSISKVMDGVVIEKMGLLDVFDWKTSGYNKCVDELIERIKQIKGEV